ncbi:sentrin/SUMO-specific protease, putative [Perkinsus marinus ATCC 50983]|uniref:Sentrin/SUMO-specific protease, putative n=1 Tax=Perkinsus marinus (strain ATCC 50983 / TXsc) TaxID=423536 RepID=C5KAM0_PERM5|nr:sentrin/SUMO-specific protease, putative [Perkinsus marinus ATCC 50983]EER18196.1 sentrin/SUMO-specific protease, putative [Perkinsus marinus ATCC 50983]|eukprot:XP_002786400.1 sentrin/SUMO-specific protease, putative [Perkinsus marinus ATCC 50983]
MVTVERRPRVRFSSGIKEIISKKDPWLPRGPDIHPAIEYTTAPRPAEQIKPSREYTLDEYRQAAEHSAASEGYIVKMDEFEKKKNGLQQQYDELRSRELSLRKETDKRAPEVAVEADRGVSRRPSWMVLTDEERMDGRALLCRTGSELLAPKQYNIDITAHALSCLQQGRWLNDEVVNYYFMMLQDRSDRSCKGSLPRVFLWNSFFWQKLSSNASGAYSYKSVARWSKRRHADIFSYDMMIVPIHVGKTHWALGVVDLKECTLSYYDSLGASHPKFYDYISRYIEDEHKDKGSKVPLRNPSGWQRRDAVITPTCTVPRQNNSNDCGVFMCMFAEAVSGGRSITEVSQDIIVDMRYKMACQISAGRVPGPTD